LASHHKNRHKNTKEEKDEIILSFFWCFCIFVLWWYFDIFSVYLHRHKKKGLKPAPFLMSTCISK